MTTVNRRDFLRGRRAPRTVFRPPWALDEQRFIEQCSRCNACIERCPEGILLRGDGGFPEVVFRRGACTFCGDCVTACEPHALADNGQAPWLWTAVIGERCLAVRGITCRSCGDACEVEAIAFRPLLGGRSEIEVDNQACTGCGECIRVCPENVITMGRADNPLREQN